MKRYLFQGMLLCCLLAFAIPAWSLAVIDVGSIDTLRFQTTLASSGDATELAWVQSVLSDPTLVLTDKYTTTGGEWAPVSGYAPGVYAHALLDSPEYFLIKTGNVTDGSTDFLFENLDKLSFAVIDLEVMGFTSITNVSGISHIDEFNGSTRVPEAGALILFGSGLVGLVGYRRLRRMQ